MQKLNKPRIGIDLTGSDEDSSTVLSLLLPTLYQLQHSADFLLFGEEKNKPALESSSFLSYQIVTDVIQMDENPLVAIRRKKNSSILLGMKALKKKQIGAFISMGNTGALIAGATTQLNSLPSIPRPALLTLMPTKTREIAVLDVGANTSSKSSHLIGFAAMGIAYQKARGILNPTVGLLNIGAEAIRGTPELRQAYQTLSALSQEHDYPLFYGNVEGRDVFEGKVDVLVTDGFTGNIFLKTSEGIASFLLDQLTSYDSLQKFKCKLDYSQYPGAILCGIDGIVIKCHGNAKIQPFHHSLISAIRLLEQNFLQKIKNELTNLF